MCSLRFENRGRSDLDGVTSPKVTVVLSGGHSLEVIGGEIRRLRWTAERWKERKTGTREDSHAGPRVQRQNRTFHILLETRNEERSTSGACSGRFQVPFRRSVGGIASLWIHLYGVQAKGLPCKLTRLGYTHPHEDMTVSGVLLQ